MEENKKIILKGNSVAINSGDYSIYVENEDIENLFRRLVPKGTKIIANLKIEIEIIPERIQFEGIENIINIESEDN